MNWSESDKTAHEMARPELYGKKPVKESPRAKDPQSKVKRIASAMNRTETRYAQYLDLLKAAGEIADWRFQEWTFKLAPRLHYTPDFMVLDEVCTDGVGVERITLVDVKGAKKLKDGRTTYWAEEDARVKIKACPRLWPWFRWCIVFPKSDGSWEEVEFHA
jgi:hypothetical protein